MYRLLPFWAECCTAHDEACAAEPTLAAVLGSCLGRLEAVLRQVCGPGAAMGTLCWLA